MLTHLGYSTKEIKQHEMKDDDLKILHNWLNSELSEADLTGPTVRSYWSMTEQIRDVQGVLYYRWEDTVNPRWMLIVPHAWRKEVWTCCHGVKTSGHHGRDKTREQLKYSFHWHDLHVEYRFNTDTDKLQYLLSTEESHHSVKCCSGDISWRECTVTCSVHL